MKNILMHNIRMLFYVIREIREWGTDAFNLEITMGWQSLVMQEDLARYVFLLAYRSMSGITETMR